MKDIVRIIESYCGKHELLKRSIEGVLMRIQEHALNMRDNDRHRKKMHISSGMMIACRMIALELADPFLMSYFE